MDLSKNKTTSINDVMRSIYTQGLSSGQNSLKSEKLVTKIKSVGFNKNLNKWIDEKKSDSIMTNSATVSKEQLESDKLKLYELQADISDKFISVLNIIPSELLAEFTDFDSEVYQRLVILNNHVKARIRQTNRKIATFHQLKIKNKLQAPDDQASFEASDSICSDSSKQVPEDNKLISDINSSKESDSDIDSVLNLLLGIKKPVNFDSANSSYSNNKTNKIEIANQKVDFDKSAGVKKNNFRLKRPLMMTFNYKSVNEPEKLVENGCTAESTEKKIASKIKTLPTSTVTSNMKTESLQLINNFNVANCPIKNDNKKYEENDDEIIKIGSDFFSTSSWWNDSEDPKFNNVNIINSCENTQNSKPLLPEYPEVNEISHDDGRKYFNDLEKSQNKIYVHDDNSSAVKFIGDVNNDGTNIAFNNLDFPHHKVMMDVFKTTFGLHRFRTNQLPAINAAILGHDCFVLMPTGGGKSLCYQLPALLSSGITIVISPLKSLILDQTQKLLSLDIPAMYLTSDLSNEQVAEVYRQLYHPQPDLKLLYVTPEKVSQSSKFCNALGSLYNRGKLSRFVIDEVHCVSQWGHDFRPDYKKLSVMKERYPGVPLIALTATATQRVRSDILHQLHLQSPKWFISSFNRPNLRYSVIPKKSKSASLQIADIINTKFKNDSGIVYCISRKDCDIHAKVLVSKGIKALSYHAGLENKLRMERQSQWISEKVKVICATIAFGMGIDKPNVRFVVHAAMPKSIEGYYQESGRAGRDGEPADCILLYNYSDMHRYRHMMETSEYGNAEALRTHLDNLYRIVHFCENVADCRRGLQLNYFGEQFDRQDCIANETTTCDNCQIYDQFINMDVTDDAKALILLIEALDRVRRNNVTILQVVNIYKGCDVSSISYKLGCSYREWFGRGKSMTKYEIERLLHNLVIEGYLCENMQLNNGIVCAYVAPGRRAHEFLHQNDIQIFLQKKKGSNLQAQIVPQTQAAAEKNASIKDLEQRCYTELFEIVNGIAGALDVSANSIMNMVALRAMSQQFPVNKQDMLRIPHVTKANFEKYGKVLLDITQKYAELKKDYLTENESSQTFDFEDSNHSSEFADVSDRKKFKPNNFDHGEEKTTKKRNSVNKSIPKKSSGYKNMNSTRGKKTNNNIRKSKFSNATKNKNPAGVRGNNAKTKGNRSSNQNRGPGLCELTKKYPVKKFE